MNNILFLTLNKIVLRDQKKEDRRGSEQFNQLFSHLLKIVIKH